MAQLHELVDIFGVPGSIILITIVLLVALGALYLVLQFGEASLRSVSSFAVEMLKTLRYEPKNTHPAIRVEFRLHQIFCAALFLTFGEVVLHSLFPWIRPQVENYILVVGVSSLIVIILLAGLSVRLSVRIPPS